MWLTRLSLKNPYFAAVLMFAIAFLGIIATKNIAVEEHPQIKFPWIIVSTSYNGAAPQVVESDVSKPLEQAINTINNIKEVSSRSYEGLSVVIAQFNLEVNPDVALQDVRDKVSTVAASFNNSDIKTPVVTATNTDDAPIVSIAFSSNNLPLRDITDWVNQTAAKKIQTIAGVGDIQIVGGITRQIRVNIEPYKLESLGISVPQIYKAIQDSNKNYPAGDINTLSTKTSVRLDGKIYEANDFANIVVTYRNRVPILLSDLATIIDGTEEQKSVTLANNEEAVGLDIYQMTGSNLVEVTKNIYKTIEYLNKIKPSGINIAITNDQSIAVKSKLKEVESTLVEGAFLTVVIVFLFLKSWRSTVITGLTLPISIFGTIFVINALGFTLNVVSLLALSLSVGLLIDDAIVVRENIMRHLHMGKGHYQASLDGTNEIGMAVFATTLTLVAVFLPIGFMNGIIGKFFYQFGITVTVAVLISLLISFTLDPMLSSIWHEPHDGGIIAKSWIGKYLDRFENWFDNLSIKYEKLILLCLKYKKITLMITFALLIFSFALTPFIGAEFMPKQDSGQYQVKFKTKEGSNIEYTKQKALLVSNVLKNNIKEIKKLTIGVASGNSHSNNAVSFVIDVDDKSTRERDVDDIVKQTRQILSKIGGIEVTNVGDIANAQAIRVEIKGDSVEKLKIIAEDLTKKISAIKGTVDVSNTYLQGNPAYQINVDRTLASNLGITLSDVGSTIAYLFAGNAVTQWEDPKNGQNYDVYLQIPKDERNVAVLDLLKVPSSNQFNDNGSVKMVPLSAIATTVNTFSPRSIDHVDLHRKISIIGNVEGSDSRSIFKQIDKITSNYKLPSGYEIVQKGDSNNMNESLMYALGALLTGIVFIYMILTAQFRSFVLPLIIMVSLPLSFVGVFIALLLSGNTLNMFSVIGIIMLMGLASKNGILLVDFINQQKQEGIEQIQAIINAGKVRLRPIIMTSVAMIFGMLPSALSGSESGKPMAYAVIGGIVTSTLLTLLVLPVVYIYLSRFADR